MMLIVLIPVVLACAYWAYWATHVQRMERATAALPTLPGLPLLGNAMLFIGNTQKILANLQKIADLAYLHKGAAKIWLGPKLYVAVGNPEDSQVILENCLDKDAVYRFLRPWLGYGLFVAPLELWKSHRKVMRSVFNNKVVEEYLEVIAEQADVLVKQLNKKIDTGDFDVLKLVTACTLDIVFETAMGERMDVQHSPDTPYLRARHTVMTILNMRFFKVWLQPDCLFNLTSYAKEHNDSIKLTHQFTDEAADWTSAGSGATSAFCLFCGRDACYTLVTKKPLDAPLPAVGPLNARPTFTPVVKKKRMEYEKNKHNNNTEDGKLKAVLDLLFGREIDFTDEQLREHIDSITIAGNDTTALTIAYTLMLLGQHKDVQEKVIQEQKSIFGDSKRGANKEDIPQMFYLERVIKESMRLYTVVPIIARNIDKDIYLPVADVTLPAGTGCVVGAFAMHRAKSVWGPDAAEFDPDRFLPERSLDRHRAAFLPFSYGSRNCIGRNYGMLIMKSILSTIIRSYKIDADDVGPLKMELLLFPIRGHQVRISKRD